MEELKNCPFCGKQPTWHNTSAELLMEIGGRGNRYRIVCDCGICTWWSVNKEAPRKAWNKRT